MKKKGIIILSVSIVLVVLVLCAIFITKSRRESNSQTDKITVTVYELGTDKKIKTIEIVEPEEINKVKGYIKEIRPFKAYEREDIALLNNVEVRYNDDISIGIALSVKNHCYYSNKKENISSMLYLPDELYEWVEDIAE